MARSLLLILALVPAVACGRCDEGRTTEAPDMGAPAAAPRGVSRPSRATEPRRSATVGVRADLPPSAAPWAYRLDLGGKTSHLVVGLRGGVRLTDALPGRSRELVAAARVVFFEANLAALRPEKLLATLRLPAGASLPKLVAPRTWAFLVEELGRQPHELAPLQPWAVSPILLGPHLQMLAGGEPSPEEALRALVPDDRERYLEAPDAALLAQAAVPLACFAAILDRDADDARAGFERTDALVRAYLEGDEARVGDLADPGRGLAPCGEHRVTVVHGRVPGWRAALEPELRQGGVLVYAAANLALGPGGLLEALRATGVTATRLGPESRAIP